MTFNAFDEKHNADRRTMVENEDKMLQYSVIQGLPRNPAGRTGLCGRGMLFRWGPNQASDPIVTRSVIHLEAL